MLITTKRSPIDTVREWTIALGVLTSSGRMTANDAELKLKAYVPLLLEHFPQAAFTHASLHHVAAQCQWFPSYAEVTTHLRSWWRNNRPINNALPPPTRTPEPERSPPTDDEIAAVHQLVQQFIANLRSPFAEPAAIPHPAGYPTPGPRYLTPEQLDQINPLPEGRRRAPPTQATDRPTNA